MEGLAKEWDEKKSLLSGQNVISVYFGGGTPTCLSWEIYQKILSWVPKTDDCEITIEANPDGIGFPQLQALRKLGINRISFGVQSFDEHSLQLLERRHSATKAKSSIFDAQKAGFRNISIDLMFDLPHQDLRSWEQTLEVLPDLPITHLSLYNLTIEPHTPFDLRRDEIKAAMPTEEISLQLLQTAIDALERIGFKRYEISAFAKQGFASRHNSGYWLGRPFLGFGPSAFSDWEGRRFRNIPNLQRYRQALIKHESSIDFEETLPYPANVNERLAIGLRLLDGIEIGSRNLPIETMNQLSHLEKDGLIKEENGRWKLTNRGTLLYDTVAEELISECQ